MMIDGAPALQIYPAFFGGAPVQSVALDKTLGSIRLLRWIGRELYLRAEAAGQQGKTVRRISLDDSNAAVVVSDSWKMTGAVRGADIRPDGGGAVVVVSKDGQEDLWTINLDGSSPRQLTSDAFFDREPIWIDSRRVVFQSNRGGQVDLWQIDVGTKVLTALTSSEAEEVAESSSLDGRIISFQQLTKDANLWMFGAAGGAQQVTQDSLSDYAPVLSGDGRTVAFQRSQPTPSRGYTIFDAKVFVAPFDGRVANEARAIADGFAPDLSADGQWLATMQISDVPRRMTLSVHDLRRGGHTVLSRTVALPSLTLSPVDWATRLTGWSRDGNHLYFVDHPDGHAIRGYRAQDPAPGPPLTTAPDSVNVRDLSVAPETGHIGYVASSAESVSVHDLDPLTGADRVLARWPRPAPGTGMIGRGWFDQRFLLIRQLAFNADGTSDIEFLTVGQDGTTRTAGRATHVFQSTARLHATSRSVYMTRLEQGTSNVYMLSLVTGALTPVTQNVLPGVTFSGFQPSGQGVIGVREESRQDIWLIQQTATKRPGNPAAVRPSDDQESPHGEEKEAGAAPEQMAGASQRCHPTGGVPVVRAGDRTRRHPDLREQSDAVRGHGTRAAGHP
jgi:Tol biopolymer transport system component